MAVIKQKMVPHLWFDREAKDAANFYCSVFPNSSITGISTLHDTPTDDCDVVRVPVYPEELISYRDLLLNAYLL